MRRSIVLIKIVMTILVLGINHKTASVDLREKVAFSDEKKATALSQIQEQGLADSTVILSTCNRTEVYLHNKSISPEEHQLWANQIEQWFATLHNIPVEDLESSLYCWQNLEATEHLMRVACGLDSLVLGEPQILGQVKQAFQQSESYYQESQQRFSTEFSRLFQKVFSTAKKVRSETQIGKSAVSVAYAACLLAREKFDCLKSLNILLVGAGETIELIARHLLRHGVGSLTIANRTQSRAEELIEKLDHTETIHFKTLAELPQALAKADIVITSTGSSEPLISKDMVKSAQLERFNKAQLIIDIAVPRDVEAGVTDVEGVEYFNVDNLHNLIQHNLHQREKASQQAEVIINKANNEFFEWLKVRQFTNLIQTYRKEAEQTRLELLGKAKLALEQGENAEQILQELSYKLTNKLIHNPTQAMQTMMKKGNSQGLRAFSQSICKADCEQCQEQNNDHLEMCPKVGA